MSEVINSLVKDTSHYNTLLMHLMKRWHGPRGVLNLLSEENKRWWEHFNCFRYIKEELKVFILILFVSAKVYTYHYVKLCCSEYACIHAHRHRQLVRF